MTYKEKLEDPRWQKKRLEILNRDNWVCQCCGEKEIRLDVHHYIYKAKDPWDEKNYHLITLCKECHFVATELDKLSKRFGEETVFAVSNTIEEFSFWSINESVKKDGKEPFFKEIDYPFYK